MNIDQRLNILETRGQAKEAFTPEQIDYMQKMIAGAGCNKTIEELDAGRNLGVLAIILTAYGLDPTENTGIIDVPKL